MTSSPPSSPLKLLTPQPAYDDVLAVDQTMVNGMNANGELYGAEMAANGVWGLGLIAEWKRLREEEKGRNKLK